MAVGTVAGLCALTLDRQCVPKFGKMYGGWQERQVKSEYMIMLLEPEIKTRFFIWFSTKCPCVPPPDLRQLCYSQSYVLFFSLVAVTRFFFRHRHRKLLHCNPKKLLQNVNVFACLRTSLPCSLTLPSRALKNLGQRPKTIQEGGH